MKKLLLITIILLLSSTTHLFSQQFNDPYADYDSDSLAGKGWHFGLNLGFYFPNAYTANFYSGNYTNENQVEWLLKNSYWYETIRTQHLNGYNVIYDSAINHYKIDYQKNMKYDAVFSPGFYIRYNVSRNLGFFMQFGFAKLRTSGVFSLHIDSVTYTSEPALRNCFVTGTESRSSMDVGVYKSFDIGQITQIFLEGAINMTNTRVLTNEVDISGYRHSIINRYGNQTYVPNTNLTEYDIYQGGIGFGISATAGLRFIFSDNISIDPAFQGYWQNTNLTGYQGFKFNYNIFIRLILTGII